MKTLVCVCAGCFFLLYYFIKNGIKIKVLKIKCQRKLKGESRMDNPETLAILGIEKYETKIYIPVFNLLAPFVCCDQNYKICFTRTK